MSIVIWQNLLMRCDDASFRRKCYWPLSAKMLRYFHVNIHRGCMVIVSHATFIFRILCQSRGHIFRNHQLQIQSLPLNRENDSLIPCTKLACHFCLVPSQKFKSCILPSGGDACSTLTRWRQLTRQMKLLMNPRRRDLMKHFSSAYLHFSTKCNSSSLGEIISAYPACGINYEDISKPDSFQVRKCYILQHVHTQFPELSCTWQISPVNRWYWVPILSYSISLTGKAAL